MAMKQEEKQSKRPEEKVETIDFKDSKYYQNRELSWLDFNYRVLEEARDKNNPLFERMKFLSITSSNLDEFFMVRVASLKDMVHAKYMKTDIAGMTASQQLVAINDKTHRMVAKQYTTFNRSLVPQLKAKGLNLILHHEMLDEEQKEFVDEYFQSNVYPVLTPLAVDSSRPFPLIRNRSLNIGALVVKKGKKEKIDFATVQVPSVLPRFIEIPGKEGKTVILLEQIIERNLSKLFLNYRVLTASPYRIMRNADLDIDEEDAADLLKEIKKQLKKRQWGEVIRLEVEDGIDRKLLKILRKEFSIIDADIFRTNGPIDLTFLMKLYGMKGFEALKQEKYVPQQSASIHPNKNLFEQIREKDILLSHPYESFDPVVDFVRQAAEDPDVLAIKQTLYRVSGHSPIIAALAKAAENGKQVTVLVELKARFDEENNINWAITLEKAGCNVLYGLRGLKVHSKITLVVRKEQDQIVRYVHLGTGNYNDSTAKLYTDMGMFTCREEIGEDATAVFNMLSGYSKPAAWNRLLVAPYWLRDGFVKLIRREAENARAGKEARIIAKMNSLCDKGIIEELYQASAAGVEIDLIIRGICCLKTGIEGVSENIRVRSIVGTFLEHSRIFYFYNDGKPEVYMGSADWMPRNLDKRVEIAFPVLDEDLKNRVIHILDIQLQDTMKARILDADGLYKHVDKRGRIRLNSQDYFCKEALGEEVPVVTNSQI